MATVRFSVRDYAAVVAILLVLVMTVLDVTLVNVSLPVLATEFGISDSEAVWIVTAYQLAITMLLLPLSSVGDIFSYRRNFLIGVVIFTVSSALCAASQSFGMIVAARTLQGIGAACIMSVNIALTRLIYPPQVLGRGLGLNAMVIATATAAGPTLAGAILSVASWHWLFIINIPLGVIVLIVGHRLLPHNPPRDHRVRFDWVSAVENMVVFGLIFYAMGNLAREGDLTVNLLLLASGIIVGVFYVRRQFSRELPMLPVDLLRIRLYTLSILTSVCSFIAQNLTMISLPFLFLNNLGFSEITTGMLMTPMPVATMIMSPLAARWVERHNPGTTAAVGMGLYALGVLLLATLTAGDAGVTDVVLRMALCGLGFGLFQTPNNVVMVIATPISRTGGAGGMQSTARLVGQTLGATLVTLVFALIPASLTAVRTTLYIGMGMALLAATVSLTRSASLPSR